jgi:hypothetical protein
MPVARFSATRGCPPLELRERRPADRVFTACERETQGVVHRVMHRNIRRFFRGSSPAFPRACQLMRVVRRTRSPMTAFPRSYDLLLHRLISDFSTELSPAHQPVLHNLSTGLSTGCTYPLQGFAAAKHSRAHQRGPNSTGQRSVDSGVGTSKNTGLLTMGARRRSKPRRDGSITILQP